LGDLEGGEGLEKFSITTLLSKERKRGIQKFIVNGTGGTT